LTPRTHRDLDAWKEGVLLAQKVYKVTEALPDQERYGLTAQMRRAAVSVPSNIAEGAARASRKEFAQFLHHALGSLAELDTQLVLAEKLGWMGESGITADVERVRMVIYGLIRHLKKEPKDER